MRLAVDVEQLGTEKANPPLKIVGGRGASPVSKMGLGKEPQQLDLIDMVPVRLGGLRQS